MMKFNASYSFWFSLNLLLPFHQTTSFSTKTYLDIPIRGNCHGEACMKSMTINFEKAYRNHNFASCLYLSSIDQARPNRPNKPGAYFFPQQLNDESDLNDSDLVMVEDPLFSPEKKIDSIVKKLQNDFINKWYSEKGYFYQGLVQHQTHNVGSPTQINKSIASSQPQIPIYMRVVKGVYEELFPWIVTLIFPVLGSLLFQDFAPFKICCLGELSFLLYCTSKLLVNFDRPTIPEPLLGERRWEYVLQSVWDSVPENIESRRSFFMGYFYDESYDKLRREDAMACLAWMRYGLPLEKGVVTDNMISKLENFDLPLLENQINNGKKLPYRKEGEEALGIMRFNLEPIRYRHKPLAYYFVTHSMYWWAKNALVSELGFQYFPSDDTKKDIGYWYKPPKKSGNTPKINRSEESPLVFVHGIGGITFYYSFIKDLVEAVDVNVPIILLDLPHISLRINDNIPEIASQVHSICKILDSTLGREKDGSPKKATFVGHSFGSILLSWMVQSNPDRLRNCIFMDPICFQLHLKDILYNFHMQRMDRRNQSDVQWTNPLSLGGIVNLAGTEMHTNYATLRKFSWATNELWPVDLIKTKTSAAVLLSENDEIVPTREVDNQIERFNSKFKYSRQSENFVKSYVFKNASHGEMFLSQELRKTTIRKVLAMIRLQNMKNAMKTETAPPLKKENDKFLRLPNLWHPDGFTEPETPSVIIHPNFDSVHFKN